MEEVIVNGPDEPDLAAAMARVREGVKFLNSQYPEWRNDFDIELMDISNTLACPLSQASGRGYWCMLDNLGMSRERAAQLGFDTYGVDWVDRSIRFDDDEQARIMNKAWRRVLAEEGIK